MMKRYLTVFLLIGTALAYSQNIKDTGKSENPDKKERVIREVTIPAAKGPKEPDSQKVEKAAVKDEGKDAVKNAQDTIKYGIESEILDLIKKLNDNDDPRFSKDLYVLFSATKSVAVRDKIIEYFTRQEDPCLEDFAVEVLDDPYDTKDSTVNCVFNYVAKVKTVQAVPAILNLIEAEDEQYFDKALSTLGEIGGTDEAEYLAGLLDRDDLSISQRQNLMKVLGKIKAESTRERLTEIALDEDENNFVRMYAAQAIGEMKAPESIPVLVDLFEAGDPNFRQYVIKGLSNYQDSEAQRVIIQGIRDAHWRVRLEAVEACDKMKLSDAVDYLIYRAKNDPENVVKDKCYSVLGSLNLPQADEFLEEQIKNDKTPDNHKNKACEALLKNKKNGNGAIKNLGIALAGDDRRKPARYSIGKLIAKYPDPSFEEVCIKYLESKDAQTCALGLDMFASGRYSSCEGKVKLIAEDKKSGANGVRAKKILKID